MRLLKSATRWLNIWYKGRGFQSISLISDLATPLLVLNREERHTRHIPNVLANRIPNLILQIIQDIRYILRQIDLCA